MNRYAKCDLQQANIDNSNAKYAIIFSRAPGTNLIEALEGSTTYSFPILSRKSGLYRRLYRSRYFSNRYYSESLGSYSFTFASNFSLRGLPIGFLSRIKLRITFSSRRLLILPSFLSLAYLTLYILSIPARSSTYTIIYESISVIYLRNIYFLSRSINLSVLESVGKNLNRYQRNIYNPRRPFGAIFVLR